MHGSNDRIPLLRGGATLRSDDSSGTVDRLAELGITGCSDDEEFGPSDAPTAPEPEVARDFFRWVADVKQKMSTLRADIRTIDNLHGDSIKCVSTDESKRLHRELDSMMEKAQDCIHDLSKEMKSMEKENKNAESSGSIDSQQLRIRTSMHNTLVRKFMQLSQEYQELQAGYREKYKERVERQYKIVNPQATEEQVEAVLQGDNSQIFANQLLSPSHMAAKSALEDIQEKHRDIQKLERSIEELYQLFIDMSVLVETQGELINQIEYSVEQAHGHVEAGIDELNKARDHQKKARKKMCYIILCVTCLMIIIAAVLLGVLKSSGVF